MASLTLVPHVPTITPIPESVRRPLWSVMIPTYNCAEYLYDTLQSVLAQAPEPDLMQIEVVDDFSTKDDPESIVNEVGRGRIKFFRQPTNVGAVANFNTCVQRSQGKLVHILHGDDLVRNGFYERLGRPLLENEKVGAAFCRQVYVDTRGQEQAISRLEQSHSGILDKALEILAIANRIQPPAMVIKRQVYEILGGYDHRLFHAADWEMWVRIAASYHIWYEVEPLALYRVHTASDTSKLFQTGANMQNRRTCIEICRNHLPPAKVHTLTRRALGYSTIYGLRMAYKFLKAGKGYLSWVQLREAAICTWYMFQLPQSTLSP